MATSQSSSFVSIDLDASGISVPFPLLPSPPLTPPLLGRMSKQYYEYTSENDDNDTTNLLKKSQSTHWFKCKFFFIHMIIYMSCVSLGTFIAERIIYGNKPIDLHDHELTTWSLVGGLIGSFLSVLITMLIGYLCLRKMVKDILYLK